MTDDVVVLGSGYAGTGAVTQLESELDGEADLTWISEVDHHFVLHESHRCIRTPALKEKITFSIDEIKSPSTRFLQGRVEAIDVEAREITLEDDSTVSYDYLLVGIGSRTAFFGIEGLRKHSLTLKSRQDALDIHDAVTEAAREATRSNPAEIVVGGAGLSGIQSAGEIAEFRDKHRAPIDVHLVEGLGNVLPGSDPVLQGKLRKLLGQADIEVHTGEFVSEVDEDTIYVDDAIEMPYDVLVWTGGITGQDAARTADVKKDKRSNRIEAASTFQTSDERVFAIGDAALIEQPNGEITPPTAQAAWQAAEVAGENIARAIRGQPLVEWSHEDKGTLVSVGEDAVAHNVVGFRMLSDTFGGPLAKQLKKAVAARWINDIAGPGAAAKAYPDM